MATIIVFSTSLSIASLLFLAKAIELKFNKKNIILSLICKLDQKSSNLINSIKFRTLQLIQTVRYIFLVKIGEILREHADRFQEKIMLEYKMSQDTIMGRKDISKRGSVSFYLKKITEEKQVFGGGKIEDSI